MFEPVLRSATHLIVPAVVIGEFHFGIRLSRHYRRFAELLAANLSSVEVVAIDQPVAVVYGEVRLELKKAGTPIPVNDTWIAAIARHLRVPVIFRDSHFDAVAGIKRIAW
ncbi:MAG: PIN domain-containing protein [Planctomycetota bacterium]